MKSFFVVILSLLLFTACLKEELPVTPYNRGNVITAQVSMGNDYGTQVWYKLNTHQIVKTNAKTAWDLAFSCNDSNYVLLNTSLAAQAAPCNTANFNSVNSDAGLNYKIDHPGGNYDSLALKDLLNGNVFIVDRGFTPSGNAIGKKKIQLLSVNTNQYVLKYADLNGSNEHTVSVTKNPDYHYIYLSFSNNQILTIEPQKYDWDLCFTSYTHVFYDPYTPYLVTGVLINTHDCQAAKIFHKNFADIQYQDVLNTSFTNQRDIIGYDWKTYNFNTAQFEIDFNKNYLIKDSEGFYYKLRFIGFYDNSGNKGNPKFEFQKL